MLASYGSSQFVWRGFVLVLAASVIGTLRWVLTQSLLKAMDDGSHKILAVVYYISPVSALGLLPIAVASEASDLATSRYVLDSQLLALSMAFIFVSGCLAFVLIFIEILLVKKTSALSLGIAGSFKDVTQVLLAVVIFGDQLVSINVFGLVVATCGMLFYTFLKHSAVEVDAPPEYKRVPTSLTSSSSSSSLENGLQDDDRPQVIHMKDLRAPSTPRPMGVMRRESKEYHAELLAASGASHV